MYDAFMQGLMSDAPLLVLGGIAFAFVMRALYAVEKALIASVHSLDTRLRVVETKIHYPVEKRAYVDPQARIPTVGVTQP